MKRIRPLAFVLLLTACSRQMDYPIGHVPDELRNFNEVNSVYDDYNSTLNVVGSDYILQFSTNRYSTGKQFDLVKMKGWFRWNQDNGNFMEVVEHFAAWSMYDSIITAANELGPFGRLFRSNDGDKYVLLYATDESGNFDIKFSYQDDNIQVDGPSASPQGISFINTSANELYPSFLIQGIAGGFDQERPIEKMFYCSDKSGNFDIYQIDFPSDQNVISFLSSKSLRPSSAVEVLNTAYEDKCPFFSNNRLVFASNRPGGFGGYDLYYSIYENGAFSAPVNFGQGINTEYDEYRPIIDSPYSFDNELLLFSSNRPGGKGGYDLYHKGIPKVE